MAKVIIGIHGLANKPPEPELAKWWKKSLVDGLRINCNYRKDFHFHMVYWAGMLYKNPQHTDPLYSFDNLYNEEPYVAPGKIKEYRDNALDTLWAGIKDIGGDLMEAASQNLLVKYTTKMAMDKLVRDLAFYYDPKRRIANQDNKAEVAGKVLKDTLADALREHVDDTIMIIAHSMGSIIAYDTLRDLGRSRRAAYKKLNVTHFVTIGSPLGFPTVRLTIAKQRSYDPRTRTPTIVRKSWKNFADKQDLIAVDAHLHDDYHPNSGKVQVEDDLVANDYIAPPPKNKSNPHKSYGYLRTPELSEHVKIFLTGNG